MLNVNEKKYVYEVLRERKYDQEYHIQEISKIVVHRYKQIEILKYKKKIQGL